MKLTINIADQYTELEITVNYSRMDDELNKLVSSIKMYDMKIPGRKEGRECVLEIADIVYIESFEKRTFLYTLTDTFENNFKLFELEEKLINRGFLRTSRNCLVNTNFIKSIQTETNSRLIITLPNEIKLIVSRLYATEIKQKLEELYV